MVIESFDDQNPAMRLRYLLQPAASVKVSADPGLALELEQVLGAGNVRFVSLQKRKPGGNGNGKRV